MLLGRINLAKEEIVFNKDEVEEIKFVFADEITSLVRNSKITPWFDMISKTKLDDYYNINLKNEMKNELNMRIHKFC